MDRNCTPASPATALASSVLPVPGGPTSSTPLGMRAPISVNACGSFKKATISCSSSFSSSHPATSRKVLVSCASAAVRVRALEKRATPPAPPPPDARTIMAYHRMPNTTMMMRYGKKLSHHGVFQPSFQSYSVRMPASICASMVSPRSSKNLSVSGMVFSISVWPSNGSRSVSVSSFPASVNDSTCLFSNRSISSEYVGTAGFFPPVIEKISAKSTTRTSE